jgi:hypothetical protein
MSLLFPTFYECKSKARFARWLAFNRQCSNDPACVINFNFQEGSGEIVKNSAIGCEAKKFDAKDYLGIIKGDYEWEQGRWWKGKKALQFNGVNTYIDIDKIDAINFDHKDDFTILVWVKFDRLRKWDGLFSKSYIYYPPEEGHAQYDLYYDGTAYTSKTGTGQFEVDVCRKCVGFDDVTEDGQKNITLDTEHWFHLVLRNRYIDDQQKIDVFFNGHSLVHRKTNFWVSKYTKCPARLAIGAIRARVNDSSGTSTIDGKMMYFFKGKIDEFLVYRRALSNSEIMGHYKMGEEHSD